MPFIWPDFASSPHPDMPTVLDRARTPISQFLGTLTQLPRERSSQQSQLGDLLTSIYRPSQVNIPTQGPPGVQVSSAVTGSPPVPGPRGLGPWEGLVQQWSPEVLKLNPEFTAIVAAAIRQESGDDPRAQGDILKGTTRPQSYGLFQMHDRGAGYGMSPEERMDPHRAASIMVPQFAQKYLEVKARRPDLAGPFLASQVIREVERPFGYEDPNGAAALAYIAAWRAVIMASNAGAGSGATT